MKFFILLIGACLLAVVSSAPGKFDSSSSFDSDSLEDNVRGKRQGDFDFYFNIGIDDPCYALCPAYTQAICAVNSYHEHKEFSSVCKMNVYNCKYDYDYVFDYNGSCDYEDIRY